jgi:hypothetical protein
MNESSHEYLDVPALLDRSQPRSGRARLWQAAGVFVLVVLISAYFSSRGGQAAHVLNMLSGLIMLALVAAMAMISWLTHRRAHGEQFYLEGIEELIRLRRWAEAGAMLQELLSGPARTPQSRVQALIFLTGVLARYNRFDDAITVQNYLLENVRLDEGTAHGLKLARAMAMLREDHLVDADRAIGELRRQVSLAGRAMDQAAMDAGREPQERSPQSLSAGLALVEMYRDVKTGHAAEAAALFEATLPTIREQLGHRVADAHVLAARAYDQLGRQAEAQTSYQNATLLAPAAELHRRYPETAALADKYRVAETPR